MSVTNLTSSNYENRTYNCKIVVSDIEYDLKNVTINRAIGNKGFDILSNNYSENASFELFDSEKKLYKGDKVTIKFLRTDDSSNEIVYTNDFYVKELNRNGETTSYTCYDILQLYDFNFPDGLNITNATIENTTCWRVYDIVQYFSTNYGYLMPSINRDSLGSLYPKFTNLSAMTIRNMISDCYIYFSGKVKYDKRRNYNVNFEDFCYSEGNTSDDSYMNFNAVSIKSKYVVLTNKHYPAVDSADDATFPYQEEHTDTSYEAKTYEVRIGVINNEVKQGVYDESGKLLDGTDIPAENILIYELGITPSCINGSTEEYSLNWNEWNENGQIVWDLTQTNISFPEMQLNTDFFTKIYSSTQLKQAELNIVPCFDLQIGSNFNVTKEDGTTYTMPIINQTITYDGGVSMRIGSGTLETSSNSSTSGGSTSIVVNGADTQRMQDYDARISSLEKTFINLDSQYVSFQNLASAIGQIGYLSLKNALFQKIQSETITTNYLKASEAHLDWAEILSGTIENSMIKDSTIENSKIKDSTIENSKIKNATITGAKINFSSFANGCISGTNIDTSTFTNGSISGTKIADSTISNSKIANATIENTKIKDGTIENSKIKDATLTGAKIKDAEIGFEKVDTSFISNLTSDNAFITSLSSLFIQTNTLIADSVIGAQGTFTDWLTGVNVYANNITAGTLSVDRLVIRGNTNSLVYELNNVSGALQANNVDTLNGEVITPRTITCDRIVAGSITSNEIHSSAITSDKIASNAILVGNMSTDVLNYMSIGTNLVKLSSEYFEQGCFDNANGLKTESGYFIRSNKSITTGTGVKYAISWANGSKSIYNARLYFYNGLVPTNALTPSNTLVPKTGFISYLDVNSVTQVIDVPSGATQILYEFSKVNGTTINVNDVNNICFKMELGTKFTAFTMSQEETSKTILDWCVNNDTTYIDGSKLYNESVTTEKLATNAIKSLNYVPGVSGLFLNLFDGSLDSKYLKWNNNGYLTATGGTIGGFEISDKYIFTGNYNGTLSNAYIGVAIDSENSAILLPYVKLEHKQIRMDGALILTDYADDEISPSVGSTISHGKSVDVQASYSAVISSYNGKVLATNYNITKFSTVISSLNSTISYGQYDVDVASYSTICSCNNSEIKASNCFLAGGTGLKATHKGKSVFGKYNEDKDDTIFEIGCGYDPALVENYRKNAFEIGTDGNTYITGHLFVNGTQVA